jgi:hypothetical protein
MEGLTDYINARRIAGTSDDDEPPTRPLNPPEMQGELMRVTGELRLDEWIAKRARQRMGNDDCPPTERNCGPVQVESDPQKMNVNDWPANDEVVP